MPESFAARTGSPAESGVEEYGGVRTQTLSLPLSLSRSLCLPLSLSLSLSPLPPFLPPSPSLFPLSQKQQQTRTPEKPTCVRLRRVSQVESDLAPRRLVLVVLKLNVGETPRVDLDVGVEVSRDRAVDRDNAKRLVDKVRVLHVGRCHVRRVQALLDGGDIGALCWGSGGKVKRGGGGWVGGGLGGGGWLDGATERDKDRDRSRDRASQVVHVDHNPPLPCTCPPP